MVKRNIKKCTSGGREREDRTSAQAKTFGPLNLEIHYPDSAMVLLGTPERPILLSAAAALASYGERAPENLERLTTSSSSALFDLDVVGSVLKLVGHEDLVTRRFALKLLALMSAVPNVRTHLLRPDGTYIAYFTDAIVDEADVFVQEFASRIVAELTSNPAGSAMFIDKYPDVGFLFEKMEAEDPDVKRNCVEILDNLVKDFEGLNGVFYSKGFSFGAIYELFRQPYPIIQELALDVIEHLAMHNADDYVQERFRQSDGLQHLLDMLENEEWNDLHSKVLRILDLACDNAKTAEHINNADGTKRLFNFMENTENEKLKFEALKVVVCLAESLNGKKLLHSRGLVKYLVNIFETNVSSEVQATVCQGIAKMCRFPLAAEEISQMNPANYILNLLNNDQASWPERQAAAYALKELLASDYQSCVNFLENNGHVHLKLFIGQPANAVPWETQVTVVEAISAIAYYSPLAQILIDLDLLSALCAAFEPDSQSPSDLKIASCDALAPLSTAAPCDLLIRVDLLRRLYPHLSNHEPLPVRAAIVRLLLLIFNAVPILARLAIQEGYLVHMLKNRSTARMIPGWSGCLGALFSADLPMKFAHAGRLSLRDVTVDGFYALRRCSCPFPALEELLRLKLCPLEPIYVANFGEASPEDEKEDGDVDDDHSSLAGKCAAFEAARAAMRRASLERGVRVSEGTINAWLELKFGRLQPDPDLRRCLGLLRAEIQQQEGANPEPLIPPTPAPLVSVNRLAARAQYLGRFVARQLSGLYQTPNPSVCVEQQLELHLRALKDRLETSVIPLGLLRVGAHLERALLFKVLADRVGLPASLVRGRYGRSWVEVAVVPPNVDPASPKTPPNSPVNSAAVSGGSSASSTFDALPGTYLRENFIVDLMDVPGDLIPIGSARALKFQDPRRPVCEFACCN